jgi:hypothetical protein
MQQIRLWHSETETGPYVYIVVGQDLHIYACFVRSELENKLLPTKYVVMFKVPFRDCHVRRELTQWHSVSTQETRLCFI